MGINLKMHHLRDFMIFILLKTKSFQKFIKQTKKMLVEAKIYVSYDIK
jgi:hypothetical protein